MQQINSVESTSFRGAVISGHKTAEPPTGLRERERERERELERRITKP
jgi:hypothetical protein